MALLESLSLPMGSKVLDFKLEGTDGKKYSLEDFDQAKVLVLVFMCNHCPYVQAIWDRLVELQARFEERGVRFVGINPNTANPEYSEETMEKMQEHYQLYAMNFPYLEDKDQTVALKYQAQCTPDIYVYNSERKLSYHGRVDDNWKDAGAVEKEELADALEALLNGEAVDQLQRPAIGCSIKWVV